MGPALGGVDRVGEGVHGLRETGVPLQRDFCADAAIVVLRLEIDDVREMRPGRVQVFDEVGDPTG